MDESDCGYDVAIIGSGIAGSALASILSRQGLDVIVFEAKSHPRFSIGESMILETSEMMRSLAELYEVPELAYFSSENYFKHIGSQHGVKRHFSYLHHTQNTPHDLQQTLQAVIPKQPHGHELHLYRQDTDYFMMTTAVRYGATVLQETPVRRVHFGDECVLIEAKDATYTAKYIVDACGFRSILRDQFDLTQRDLQAHSRALFTHMVDVPCVHEVTASKKAYDVPFRISEGTLHHVFDGGWLWVIPFNNHDGATNPIVSVGLMLDPRRYPQRDDLTPHEEFQTIISAFPSVAAQFKDARCVREWVRAPRIQYRASEVVGERWALLGHAAGFVDPLYSKGLYVSFASVSMLAYLLLGAQKTGDFSARAFQPLEKMTHGYLAMNDRLVANSYKSWGNDKLWRVYSVLWLLGAYTELIKLMTMRAQANGNLHIYHKQLAQMHLAGGGFPAFMGVADEIDGLLERLDMTDEKAVEQTAAKVDSILRSLDWIPEPFVAILDGKTSLPRRKLRPELLNPSKGFFRTGTYREHFFGDVNWVALISHFVEEKVKYSSFMLNRQRA